MRGKQTLVINGKVYDAITGLPVAAPNMPPRPTTHTASPKVMSDMLPTPTAQIPRSPQHAKAAHHTVHRSATLRREYVKKPASKPVVGAARRRAGASRVEKSAMVSRFAAHPQPFKPVSPPAHTSPGQMDIVSRSNVAKPAAIVAQKHALVTPAHRVHPATPALTSRSLKEQLIAEKLASVEKPSRKEANRNQKRMLGRQPRGLSLATISLAIVVFGGYLTYLNMPGLSVRVAAAQADVAASFPDYHPDGYRFNGPVAYAPGQVAINFQANGGTQKYTVTEQKSTWDSQAVYDNVVAKTSEDSYITNSQQGLTIYTFKGDAAWVNKGILYTITGDAPLSNEQLLRIANSL